MKRMRKALTVVLSVSAIFLIFALPVSAEDGEIDRLLNEFWQLMPDNGSNTDNSEDLIEGVGFDAFLSEIASALSGGGELLSFMTLLLGLSLAFMIAELAAPMSADLQSCTRTAASLISSTLIFSSLIPLVLSASEALAGLATFFSGVIPIASGIIAAGGALGTASVQAVNMNIALSVIEKISAELLLPLVLLMFSLSMVSSVDSQNMTVSVAKGVRSFFFWALGIVTTVLIASVSLQSIISSASDSAALRAAKYAAGSSIPIVGSTVSAALGMLFASASYAGASVGVGAVSVIISISLSPLIILLAYRFALSLFSSVLGMLGADCGAGLFASFRSSLDALIAVYSSSVLICLFEIIIFMKCGVRTFG